MKILEKILFYGLILILFIPLVIGQDMIFPFVTTKTYLFYAIVDVLLIAYLPHQATQQIFVNIYDNLSEYAKINRVLFLNNLKSRGAVILLFYLVLRKRTAIL